MYRAYDNCQPAGRDEVFYYCKRGEFALYYLSAIEALGKAAAARREGKQDAYDEQFETAVESMYNALTCMGEVARDQSDLATIAVLNEYAYRPLARALEQASAGK
jgi:hypothetical protein